VRQTNAVATAQASDPDVEDGTYTNASERPARARQAGRYVLLTDDRLIPQFQGRPRAATARGRPPDQHDWLRLSFGTTNNFLNLSGFFAIGQSLTGMLFQGHDEPTNPFKHKYASRSRQPECAFRRSRRRILCNDTADRTGIHRHAAAGTAAPDYGYSVLAASTAKPSPACTRRPCSCGALSVLTRQSLDRGVEPQLDA